ncbi:uncharacterized protein LOC135378795 isoform X1 [Ornithodoros turicata]|uniref:uncharacterized protein LOC135378795 isoform X1 n=1 Tax=Ornithodoros turicata TaxID=34597 RepID=UPI003138AB84
MMLLRKKAYAFPMCETKSCHNHMKECLGRRIGHFNDGMRLTLNTSQQSHQVLVHQSRRHPWSHQVLVHQSRRHPLSHQVLVHQSRSHPWTFLALLLTLLLH